MVGASRPAASSRCGVPLLASGCGQLAIGNRQSIIPPCFISTNSAMTSSPPSRPKTSTSSVPAAAAGPRNAPHPRRQRLRIRYPRQLRLTFVQKRGAWSIEKDIVINSDFDYAAAEDSPGKPLTQQYAWFWEKGQKLPHVISDNVYAQISNQVKVSSFLFLKTDPNELLLMTDPPNQNRPFRAMSAIIETDWYPASYPWHVVLELDRREKRIRIRKGDPICRIIPLERETYFAGEMSQTDFDDFFARGQKWLATHGKFEHEGRMDITRTYVRQQIRPKFVVMT